MPARGVQALWRTWMRHCDWHNGLYHAVIHRHCMQRGTRKHADTNDFTRRQR